ncbi:MAG: HDOD domain-containing protein [Proteobacteria bacterium]|nr:HDOD domain-containing protein [Pseudomonadota bacterium]
MDKIDAKTLRYKIQNIDTLPTLPGILKKILKALENPNVSLTEIGAFISNDPVITAKVLKMVNSAVYGFPGRISSVSQAVILLGLNVVKGLLLGVSIFELMQETMVGLWEHSMGCSIAARLIARKKGLKEPEEISIAALLHDIGKVILILQYPEHYKHAMKQAQERGVVISLAEEDVFAVTHADAGSWIAEKWRFPGTLTEVIWHHHKPRLSGTFSIETSIVYLADILVRARGFGFAGDSLVPAINPAVWENLKMTENDLKDILKEMEDLIEGAGTLILE